MKLPNISPRFSTLRAFHSGFSLVELMVSLTIGMVVILFVTSLFLQGKASTRLQDENNRMQEDGRAAMNLLGRNIKQAWFGEPVSILPSGLLTEFRGQGLYGCDNDFTNKANFASLACGGGQNPALQVSYQTSRNADATIGAGVDCNGQVVAPDANNNSFVTNRFFLSRPANEPNFALYCVGSGNAAISQPLLSNVESMVLTYGVDTNNDKSADVFTTSATDALNHSPAVSGGMGFPAFKGVVSVGVCLQLVSLNQVSPIRQVYTGCNGVQTTAPDNRYRLILSNVFTVRSSAGTSLVMPPTVP